MKLTTKERVYKHSYFIIRGEINRMKTTKFNFECADESDKNYLKSLNLTTFDGTIILPRNFEYNIFCDKESKAKFFQIGLRSFSDIKTWKDRQSFLKEKYKSDKAEVLEYMLICGDMKAYIFTNQFYYQEGVRVKILEIMQSGGKNECVLPMVESAFQKNFLSCPEFSIEYGVKPQVLFGIQKK